MKKLELLNYVSNKVGVKCNASTGRELMDYVTKNMKHFYDEYLDEQDFYENISYGNGNDTCDAEFFVEHDLHNKFPEVEELFGACGDVINVDGLDSWYTHYNEVKNGYDAISLISLLKEKSIEWNTKIVYKPYSHMIGNDDLDDNPAFVVSINKGIVDHDIKFFIQDDSADLFVESINHLGQLFYTSSLDLLDDFEIEVKNVNINEDYKLRGKYFYDTLTDISEIIKQLTFRPLSIENYKNTDILFNEEVFKLLVDFNDSDYYNSRYGRYKDFSYCTKQLYNANDIIKHDNLLKIINESKTHGFSMNFDGLTKESVIEKLESFPFLSVWLTALLSREIKNDKDLLNKISVKYKLDTEVVYYSKFALFLTHEIINDFNSFDHYSYLSTYSDTIHFLYPYLSKDIVLELVKCNPNTLKYVADMFDCNDELYNFFIKNNDYRFYDYASDEVKIKFREKYLESNGTK